MCKLNGQKVGFFTSLGLVDLSVELDVGHLSNSMEFEEVSSSKLDYSSPFKFLGCSCASCRLESD